MSGMFSASPAVQAVRNGPLARATDGGEALKSLPLGMAVGALTDDDRRKRSRAVAMLSPAAQAAAASPAGVASQSY